MSISISVRKKATASLLLLFIALGTGAASAHAEGEKHGRRGPPAEAIDACADLAVDQACQFTSPRGHEVSGTCFAPPRDEAQLACRPAGKKGHHGGPEEEPDEA